MKHKRVLTMDDVREGMFVTILEGKKIIRPVHTLHGEEIITRENDMYKGKILEVLSIDLPYVAVIVHRHKPGIAGRVPAKKEPVIHDHRPGSAGRGLIKDVLDLREIKLMSLGKHFVQALLPELEIQKSRFWEDVNDTSLAEADTDIEEIFKDL